jgi:hypothetical protein
MVLIWEGISFQLRIDPVLDGDLGNAGHGSHIECVVVIRFGYFPDIRVRDLVDEASGDFGRGI